MLTFRHRLEPANVPPSNLTPNDTERDSMQPILCIPTLAAMLFLLAISPPAALAVDTPAGAPEYLERTLRPRWRLETIDVVLAEIERVIDRPVQASTGVFEDRRIQVILIERKKLSLSSILTLLEENYDLHCIAEPLRLVVETRAEERIRRRRPVNLDLRDYGLFFWAPPVTTQVRITSNDSSDYDSGSPYNFGSDREQDDGDLPFELQALLDEFNDEDSSGGGSLRGTGALLLQLTPEEEVTVRGVLEDLAKSKLARTHWRVHFGLLPGSAETRGGVVSGETARAVADLLIEPERLSLSAIDGQEAFARSGSAERTVSDIEVNQTGPYPVVNPVIDVPLAGSSIRLRVSTGVENSLLCYRAMWHAFVGQVKRSKVRTPSVTRPGQNSVNVKKDGAATASQRPEESIPGSIMEIEDRPLGRWDSVGEAFIPRGSGLILLGVVEGRAAAIVFEEVTQ